MGKSSLEPAILHEVHCYIDHFIKPNLGVPIKVTDSLMLATANVMGSMILSNRRDYDDANFMSWMHSFGDSVKAAMIAAVARNIPGAAYLPGDLTGNRTCDHFASYSLVYLERISHPFLNRTYRSLPINIISF